MRGPEAANPVVRQDRFRHAMGHVPTGVSVVTGMTEQGPAGLAVGSFVSVSLEPTLVGFLVAHASTTWPSIAPTGRFVVNVLGEDGEPTCRAFARSGGDKFAGVDWRASALGAPVLGAALAWFDCTAEQQVPAGDHSFVVGAVRDLGVHSSGRPLVFCHGGYQRLGTRAAATGTRRDSAER